MLAATESGIFRTQLYIQCSSLALLYYDYALTLPDEKEHIWRSRISLSTFLYIGCRYALVANVIYLLALLKLIRGSCNDGYLISGILSIIGRTCVVGVWSLRTWAVYGKNIGVAIWFATLGLICLVSDVVHVVGSRCQGNARFPLASKILSIVVCCIEFSSTGLTLLRCHQALRESGNAIRKRETIIYFLAQQGILYTAAVSGFTIGATVLNFCFSGGFLQRLLNALTLPVSGLMTARFILHLRKWDENTIQPRGSGEGGISPLEFQHSAQLSLSHAVSTFISDFGDDPMLDLQCEHEVVKEA